LGLTDDPAPRSNLRLRQKRSQAMDGDKSAQTWLIREKGEG